MPLNVVKRQPVAAFWYLALVPLMFSIAVVVLGLLLVALFLSAPDGSCSEGACNSIVSVVGILVLVVSGSVLSYPFLYYLLFTYKLTDRTITVNSGILFRQYETIDFKKIQAIDNERGPILMLFGLTIIEIWTASWDQLSPVVSNKDTKMRTRPDMRLILQKDEAERLRDFVMHAKG